MTVDETIQVRWSGGDERFAPGDRVVIGRETDCRVRLSHPSVSRHHAELTFADGRWLLRDLDSSQGSHRAGTRFRELPIAGSVTVVFGNPTDGDAVDLTVVDDRTE